jgi:hypothetical protein
LNERRITSQRTCAADFLMWFLGCPFTTNSPFWWRSLEVKEGQIQSFRCSSAWPGRNPASTIYLCIYSLLYFVNCVFHHSWLYAFRHQRLSEWFRHKINSLSCFSLTLSHAIRPNEESPKAHFVGTLESGMSPIRPNSRGYCSTNYIDQSGSFSSRLSRSRTW